MNDRILIRKDKCGLLYVPVSDVAVGIRGPTGERGPTGATGPIGVGVLAPPYNIYVHAEAPPGGTGQVELPFNNLAQAYAAITDNSVVHMTGIFTNVPSYQVTNVNVTFTGTAILEFNPNLLPAGYVFDITATNNVAFEGLIFKGLATAPSFNIIQIIQSLSSRVTDCVFAGPPSFTPVGSTTFMNAIFLDQNSENVQVANNIFHSLNHGIYVNDSGSIGNYLNNVAYNTNGFFANSQTTRFGGNSWSTPINQDPAGNPQDIVTTYALTTQQGRLLSVNNNLGVVYDGTTRYIPDYLNIIP